MQFSKYLDNIKAGYNTVSAIYIMIKVRKN